MEVALVPSVIREGSPLLQGQKNFCGDSRQTVVAMELPKQRNVLFRVNLPKICDRYLEPHSTGKRLKSQMSQLLEEHGNSSS